MEPERALLGPAASPGSSPCWDIYSTDSPSAFVSTFFAATSWSQELLRELDSGCLFLHQTKMMRLD